jgi:hypothetical protein
VDVALDQSEAIAVIEPDYRSYRIEITAVRVAGAWDARIRVRRTFGDMQPHIEVVTCRKPTAKAAEERAAVYARRWSIVTGPAEPL